MFVRNKTPFKVGLAHGQLAEGRSVGALVVCSAYRASSGKLAPCEEPPALPTDPPDLTRQALWSGTSVTAAGDVYGPRSSPFVRMISLFVGNVARRLSVFGDRHWAPGLTGELEPSAPARFERIALSFARAYGGHVDVPPGLFPGTDLPFPGGRLAYPLNAGGIGFHLDKAAAGGRPLPNFELPDQLLEHWNDRPTPGCFVPCPELPALRMAPPASAQWGPRTPDELFPFALRTLHHAPGYLVFDDVPPGTPIRVEGLGREALHLEAPPPPARVVLRRGARREGVRPQLRSVHVDADRAVVSCVHGHAFVYRDGDEPSWVLVDI